MIVNNQKESKDCVWLYFQVVPPKNTTRRTLNSFSTCANFFISWRSSNVVMIGSVLDSAMYAGLATMYAGLASAR